jgi:hypothetical protein
MLVRWQDLPFRWAVVLRRWHDVPILVDLLPSRWQGVPFRWAVVPSREHGVKLERASLPSRWHDVRARWAVLPSRWQGVLDDSDVVPSRWQGVLTRWAALPSLFPGVLADSAAMPSNSRRVEGGSPVVPLQGDGRPGSPPIPRPRSHATPRPCPTRPARRPERLFAKTRVEPRTDPRPHPSQMGTPLSRFMRLSRAPLRRRRPSAATSERYFVVARCVVVHVARGLLLRRGRGGVAARGGAARGGRVAGEVG